MPCLKLSCAKTHSVLCKNYLTPPDIFTHSKLCESNIKFCARKTERINLFCNEFTRNSENSWLHLSTRISKKEGNGLHQQRKGRVKALSFKGLPPRRGVCSTFLTSFYFLQSWLDFLQLIKGTLAPNAMSSILGGVNKVTVRLIP